MTNKQEFNFTMNVSTPKDNPKGRVVTIFFDSKEDMGVFMDCLLNNGMVTRFEPSTVN